ncbi:retinaldehyde-binding protein 1 [Folsomia candida]|uniref:Retinaldehyde-binding protein 1 n=1 Tax=Folsomia candida TaxID=158441 RepID=A0A226EAU2_FOLCA|nr:retinaldehyde-binding protein 1 [Folsomia candida]OXA54328.1 Retinaldehyde-binding protein 1 [Folsomia candida]
MGEILRAEDDQFGLGLIELKGRIKEHDQIEPFSDILDDNFLTGFLRGKKGDVDKTVTCLEHYIKMRTVKYKNFTKAYRPSSVNMLDKGVFQILKHPDPSGRVILLAQINNWFPSEVPFDEAIATALFIMDEGIRSYFSVGNEVAGIFDCAGFCFAQMRTMTPRNMILLLDMFMKNIPSRPKAIHFVNHGFLIHNLYRVINPLLEKKIRERVHFHSDVDHLHHHIPAKILPNSLNGELSLEDAVDLSVVPEIRSNDDFYERLSSQLDNATRHGNKSLSSSSPRR